MNKKHKMPLLKVGLIGCGRIAQLVHLNILTNLPGAELVALAEPDPQRREEANRRAPWAVAVADYPKLLAMPAVEAVVVCLPTGLHAEVAIAAFESGKHVYLEKPLAANLDEGRKVLEAWQRAGRVGMIGFNYRFNALYQNLKREIQSRRIGELVGIRSVFSAPMLNLPVWKQTRQSGGGVLLDLASHHIDLVHFLFEEKVCEVSAVIQSLRSEDDSAMLTLRLESGVMVQSFFSMNTVDADCFEIYGEAGKLTVDRYHSSDVELTQPSRDSGRLKWLWQRMKSFGGSRYFLKKLLVPGWEPSYEAALKRFVGAVQGNPVVQPDLQDGYRSLVVIESAEESARTGCVVSLPELLDENSTR